MVRKVKVKRRIEEEKRIQSKIMVLKTCSVIVLFLFGAFIYAFDEFKSLRINSKSLLLSSNIMAYNYVGFNNNTGSNLKFDSKYNPYYAKLNNNEKLLYKQIYANAVKLNSTFIPVVNLDVETTNKVLESVCNDHPELYFLENSFKYKYTYDNICRQITLKFNSLDKADKKFDEEIDNIVKVANTFNTDLEKEQYVHDTLIDKINYDSNAEYNQSAYSALVNNNTVCAGYAKAFQLIMNKLNIPTYYVTGTANGEHHAWNIVKLDGEYYNVDLTFDDTADKYKYFNKSNDEFSLTHSISDLSKIINI